uniref:BZIP domain-containing protein n=2 Tax=Pseudo-nitzschia australis TaxID=44445 RepID=A0A6U9VFM9_9STRA|mmetsp:Transcript_27509/g.60526  ORF Transcript_27509/g.60526 Transcript_27509/m.60526 type:complete len:708 (+) Transcript_27509:405-2528(+)|eukprot:CAMPEP_0168175638 /NCGR_PEP_ID=MMETSP0139_2-20121125/7261_1 /TAXON_ID=44445 /ORGANISM="Pseudo-nitzschia australis, Strain 10249 10 AB" /LENGTH=707 /DNA_ID=CAMNT_0008094103 /DNA_START=319 /DNA_END=2442 /DNA_ORIENTATION=+
MSVSTEWPVDSAMQVLAPRAEDLFGAELLGDDLMDIYNAAVVGGGDDNDDELTEMSFGTTTIDPDTEKKDMLLDDGFGAFRASTSFSNFSTVLLDTDSDPSSLSLAPPVEPSCDATPTAVSARVVSSSSLTLGLAISSTQQLVAPHPAMTYVTTPGGTKRKKPITANVAPSPKRKVSVGASGSKPKKSTPKGTTNKKATKKKIGNNSSNQPNIPNTNDDITSTPEVPLIPTAPSTNVNRISPTVIVHPAQVAIKQEPGVVVSSAQPTSSVVPQMMAPVAPQSVESSAPLAAPAATILSNPPTEADFKSVAQAAVNNLIMNAGNTNTNATTNATTKTKNEKTTEVRLDTLPESSPTSIPSPTPPPIRVDTSTEHVKALTGSNWVAVCGGGHIIGDSSSQNNNDKLNRARRSNLTPDERARQNRDRNREHARNTRLRKKAYVEELKATLSALVTQRDAAELEKRHASQRELEQREVRFRVLEEFLKLRGRNEANAARWAAILEDKFTLTMPVVSFRSMVHSNDSSHRTGNVCEQVLTGVTEVMNDSSFFSNFLQSLGKNGSNELRTLAYNCDRSNFFMDNCVAMFDWTATTQGASGQRGELFLKGQIRAKFSPASNKLISVMMSFDTGAIISQLNIIAKAKHSSDADAAAAAAQVAANEADALLDSLEMPLFEPPNSALISTKINVVPPSSASSATSNDEKAVICSDDE